MRYAPTTSLNKRDRYERLRAALLQDRRSFEAHWRDLADYLFPRRTRWWAGDRNRGDKRNQKIIDSTGRFAARTLQSGLHAGLTSPARPWFKLTTPDTKLAEQKEVASWLEIVTQRMQVVLADGNLYNVLPIVYGDMGVFGTAAMAFLDDTEDLYRCYAYPVGSYALGLDRRNRATTFVRDYELSVLQIVQEFGVKPGYKDVDWTTIPDIVKGQYDRGDYTFNHELCWLVQPNPEADPKRIGSRFLPWSSCHWLRGDQSKGFLRESGFKTFPIMAPRWDITGEDTYGTDCPGMTVLGDVKQLQIMHKRKAQAIAKMVDPPLKGSAELRTQKTSLLAGDITYLRDPKEGLAPIHEVRLDIDHLSRDIGETQYRIQRGFYEDLFLMLAQNDQQRDSAQPITAREVEERHEEKLLALGPVLERTNDELLDPIIERIYLLMENAGLIPPPPQALQGVALKVEYISIMAQAQKLVGVVAQDRFLQSVGPLIQVFPEMRNKIDSNQVVDNYGAMLGVDPRIIRSSDDADALSAQQAQAQKDQAEAIQAANMSKAVKNAGSTPVGTGSALDALVGGVTAGVPSSASVAGAP
jgi:hypothetical protein